MFWCIMLSYAAGEVAFKRSIARSFPEPVILKTVETPVGIYVYPACTYILHMITYTPDINKNVGLHASAVFMENFTAYSGWLRSLLAE